MQLEQLILRDFFVVILIITTKFSPTARKNDYDVSILNALLEDGRKSFFEISRETGITAPTVKPRIDRLVNIGFIKSISPIFNFDIVEENIVKPKLHENKDISHNDRKNENETDKEIEYNLYQGRRYQGSQKICEIQN